MFLFSLNISAQNLDVLTQMLERGNDEQKRDALLQIRNAQTAEASKIALPALKDSSEIIRATTVFSVIFLPKDEATQNLLPLLTDKKPLVRRETAYALGKVGDASLINSLLQVFQKDKIPEVRNAVVVALGEIGDSSAVSELVKILLNKMSPKEDFLRRSAARSIGQIAQIIQTGKKEVITPENPQNIEPPKYKNLHGEFPIFQSATGILMQTLQNEKEADDTRREAAFALGAIGDVTAVAVLESNLNAKDYYLAQICREALAKIGNKQKSPSSK